MTGLAHLDSMRMLLFLLQEPLPAAIREPSECVRLQVQRRRTDHRVGSEHIPGISTNAYTLGYDPMDQLLTASLTLENRYNFLDSAITGGNAHAAMTSDSSRAGRSDPRGVGSKDGGTRHSVLLLLACLAFVIFAASAISPAFSHPSSPPAQSSSMAHYQLPADLEATANATTEPLTGLPTEVHQRRRDTSCV